MCNREVVPIREVFHFEAPVLAANSLMRSGRFYPLETLEPAVQEMNETVVLLFSTVNVQAKKTMFSLDDALGGIELGWMAGLVMWVRGTVASDAAPLVKVPYEKRKGFLEEFYIVPCTSGEQDDCGLVKAVRFDGFVAASHGAWKDCGKLRITCVEVQNVERGERADPIGGP